MYARLMPALVVFFLALAIFGRRVEKDDYPKHFELTRELVEGKSVQPHPLFHTCLALFSGGSTLVMPGMAAALLATALAVRAWLTAGVLDEGTRLRPGWIAALCILLTLAMPLPIWWDGYLMVAQPSPNIWHNPTAPFEMPFSLALFLAGLRLLDVLNLRTAALAGLLMVLSLLAKPNFVLAFAPVFGPALLVELWHARRKGSRDVDPQTGPPRALKEENAQPSDAIREGNAAIGIPSKEKFAPGSPKHFSPLVILLLAFGPAILVAAVLAVVLQERRVVFFHPLLIWQRYTPSVSASILLGTAYPLTVFLCYLLRANADRALTLAWATLGVACATFGLLAEIDYLAANWGWGMHLANSVLFVMSTGFLFRQPSDWRRWLCLAVLGLHVTSGVAYLAGYKFFG
jgi:hypothetical protein